jgi:alanine racemase
MTHFATADEVQGVRWQAEPFLQKAVATGLPLSLANSAALLRYPEVAKEWVRPGIMLYGASPFADVSAASLGLKPAMTLQSEIIATQTLKAGERLGYGLTWRAEKSTKVGIVACGYGDAYPRHAPAGTPVLVQGRPSRTLGRVSMDTLYVDLSELPEAGTGSAVTLWGEGLPVEEVARAAGTISYELLCSLAPRVPVVES